MDNKINCLDLKKQYLQIKNEVEEKLQEVCQATAFAGGAYVENFENKFAQYCQTEFAVALNSGTSALHLSMLALNVQDGDEVIVPANTFIATAWGPSYAQAVPVFADCTADTWNIDVKEIEKKITRKTKAIIGVHLYGQPFDVDAVRALAQKHNLLLVEDCAQAHGAKYKGTKVGSLAEMGCFSFYPGKNLGAYGEGGAVVTNREEYKRRIDSLRNHGSTTRYYHDEIGYNMRMDGFQGAILDVKLKYLDSWNARRKKIAQRYRENITNSKIVLQHQPEWADSAYHLFVITTEDRAGLMSYLQKKNIHCGMHYPVPCHLQKVYSHLGYKKGDCPNAEYLSEHCLSLPMYAELTDEEVDRVISVLNSY